MATGRAHRLTKSGADRSPPRAPDRAALVVAHRGAWNPAPRNSLAAFERAIGDGADAVELDVRRTGDGRLIVIHDPRVGIHPVARLDHAAVRARVGAGQAPELAEVLTALAGRIIVDVELKEDGYVGEAMAVVTENLPPASYVVTSFLDAVLTQVRKAAPQARTGLLVRSGRGLGRLAQRVARTEVDFLAPQLAPARSGLIEWAAQRGLPTWVWTVNASDARRALLFDPRVEAVITDHARVAVAEAEAGPDARAVS